MNPSAIRCDDSGLCQAADECQASVGPKRRYMRSRKSAVLVDISPISVGHSLVVPAAHVTATSALTPAEFSDVWTLAERARHCIASGGATQPVVLLEHGLTSSYKGPSCVRHAHIHACPIDPRTRSWSDLETVLSQYLLFVKAATSLEAAMISAESLDSYVVGSLGPWWFAGRPRPAVRQVTRTILCSLATDPPADVDWFLGALGSKFSASLDLLSGRSASTADTSVTFDTCSSIRS